MPRSVGVKKGGSYMKLDEEMKIKIGKYSSENRVSAAVRRFSAELGRDINPSTIRRFKQAYLQELNRKRRAEEDDLTVTSLPAKKRGPRSPPTTSWRGLRTRLAKLNWRKFYLNTKDGLLAKILSCKFFVVYGINFGDNTQIHILMFNIL